MRARAGSVLVLVPSTGWAERLTARLVRRGCPAASDWDAGACRLAGRGRQPGRRLGARAPAGGRRRARRARRGLPGGERPDLQRGGGAARAGAARGRALPPGLAGPAGGAAARPGPLRTVAPPRPEERAGWPVLERVDRRGADPRSGMFSEEFVRLARSVLDDAAARQRGPLVCVYNRTGGRPPAGLRATAASWPAAPAAARPRRSRGARRCCAARAATRPARWCARTAAGCA